MGTTSPLRQAMSAAFSPETDRLRKASKEKAENAESIKGFSLSKFAPKAEKLSESGKSQDALGNPTTPGYENIWQQKEQNTKTQNSSCPNPDIDGHQIPGSNGKKIIRLSTGWEQLLLVQKKICEKARNIITMIDSQEKYTFARKNKLKKYNGCIVDLDVEEHRKEMEFKAKEEKKNKDDAA